MILLQEDIASMLAARGEAVSCFATVLKRVNAGVDAKKNDDCDTRNIEEEVEVKEEQEATGLEGQGQNTRATYTHKKEEKKVMRMRMRIDDDDDDELMMMPASPTWQLWLLFRVRELPPPPISI